eukprot:5373626-Pleurochrysis_carterae.AAC.5
MVAAEAYCHSKAGLQKRNGPGWQPVKPLHEPPGIYSSRELAVHEMLSANVFIQKHTVFCMFLASTGQRLRIHSVSHRWALRDPFSLQILLRVVLEVNAAE